MIVSIDGPAGSGKSTVADELAKKLGFIHFNSGSLYRGITAHLLRNNIEVNSINSRTKLKLETRLINNVQHVYVNDVDYTLDLRNNDISIATPTVSVNKYVRNIVDNCQREFCSKNNCVIDGRDIGSYVFPNADYKFYLDCALRERARRRYKEEKKKNSNITLKQIEAEIAKRDKVDKNKSIAPLVVPENAIIIDSTKLKIEEIVDTMYEIIN